jgi:hypothetical protein
MKTIKAHILALSFMIYLLIGKRLGRVNYMVAIITGDQPLHNPEEDQNGKDTEWEHDRKGCTNSTTRSIQSAY